MSNGLALKTIRELSYLIKTKQISPVELTSDVLDRAETLNPKVNAYIAIHRELAEKDAKIAEKEIMDGNYRGPLHGIPFALKDMFAFKDRIRTMASRQHSPHPENYEATVVSKLRKAGVIFTGTLNMMEYAFGDDPDPPYGVCKNPWNTDYFPGGSSSGSGVALAADMVIASVGSDTGGSIRTPSAYCGVVGLKPTSGRVSKYGAYPLSWTYDHIGPMAKTVEDVAIVFQHIAGYDPKDPITTNVPVPNYKKFLREDIKGLVIGVNEDHFFKDINPEIEALTRKAIRDLESMGATIKQVDIPHLENVYFIEVVTAFSEGAAVHADNLINSPKLYGDSLRQGLLLGHLITGSDYAMAQQLRQKICESFERAFEEIDVLIAPTTPNPASTLKQRYEKSEQKEVPNLKERGTRILSPANAAGLPSLSVPCGFINELPVGMQLIGKQFSEGTLFNVAYAYEKFKGITRKPSIS